MGSTGRPRRLLARLRATVAPSQAQRVERVLATARVFLAISSLIAVSLNLSDPGRYAAGAYVVLVVYVAHSLLILVLVNVRKESTSPFRLSVHAVDLLWPACISQFTAGFESPFFVYFFFALLAAAYRWGFLETLATAGAAVVLLSVEMLLERGGWEAAGRFFQPSLVLDRFIMRSVYLMIVGYLLGYLGEEQKTLRAETSGIARLIARAQVGAGLRRTLETVFDELRNLFGARQVLLVLRELRSGRGFVWNFRAGEGGPPTLDLMELDSTGRDRYFFAGPGHTWHLSLRRLPDGPARPPAGQAEAGGGQARQSAAQVTLVVLGGEGERLRPRARDWALPEDFAAAHPFRSLLGTSFEFGEEWLGRLYLLDPLSSPDLEGELRFLQTLVREAGPAVYSVYLLRRLRSRATAVERARVARELHDGVIQSLIAAEMQVEVLRRRIAENPARLADELSGIQQLLRGEVLNLRELMQQMRPLDLGPRQLLDYLADFVDRFRRETGITAKFVSELEEVDLQPRACNEVARIVQEALVNVRKHSGAQNVLVRLGSENGHLNLVIDDDGRGFGFAGRRSQAELDAEHRGLVVIKERVRSIGGELVVDSAPGRGSRLEIIFPQKSYG